MSQTKRDLTTTPYLIPASLANPVSVSVVAGDVAYYYSTSAVSSSTKDGTIDPAGTTGPQTVILTSTKWFAADRSSTVTHGPTEVSVDPLQRTGGQPGIISPTFPKAIITTVGTQIPSANILYAGRFTVTAPVTVSTGLVPYAPNVGGSEAFCVSIYEWTSGTAATRIATTGTFSFDTSTELPIAFTLAAPVHLVPGKTYFSAVSSSNTTVALWYTGTDSALATVFTHAAGVGVPYAWTKTASHPAPASITSFSNYTLGYVIIFDVT